MKKNIAIFLLFFVILSLKNFVYAKTYSLTIYPSLNEVNLTRGDSYTYYINLYNSENIPVAINVYAQNFGVAGLNGNVSFIEDKSKLQSASWFHFKNTSLVLYPYETVKYPVTVDVPQNAYPGGHYVSIFFQKVNSIKSTPSVGVIPRIGSLFFITVGGNVYYNAQIKKISILSSLFHIGNTYFPLFSMNNIKTSTIIKNLSNDYIVEKGKVYLENTFNLNKTKYSLPKHIILQNEARYLNSVIDANIGIGTYKVYTAIDYGYNQKVIVSKNIIIIPLFFLLLTFFIIFFTLVIILINIIFNFIKSIYEK